MRFNIAEMKAPRVFSGFFNEFHCFISHVGCFRIFFAHPCWQVAVAQIPAREKFTMWTLGRICKIMPWVIAFIPYRAEVVIICEIRRREVIISPKPIISLIWFETTFTQLDAYIRLRINPEPSHTFLIGNHVGFTYQSNSVSQWLKIVTNRFFVKIQRYSIPIGTMSKCIAACIEIHARSPANRGLTVGACKKNPF